jgi:transketolase
VVDNRGLRLRIAQMVKDSGEGHIPSSFSIVDVIEVLYESYVRSDPENPESSTRDFFILSKGHGAAALYAVLEKHGFITSMDISQYSKRGGILGGHPDSTRVPGAEASTGSLGHGFPMSVGIALGLKIQKRENRVFCLVGDGECQEGTIWEAANIAANRSLGNLTTIVDWNGSASQLMPVDDLPGKWRAFGWDALEVDGHNIQSISGALNSSLDPKRQKPLCIIAHTIKGKGVSFIEGHGRWHHRVPNPAEWSAIEKELA